MFKCDNMENTNKTVKILQIYNKFLIYERTLAKKRNAKNFKIKYQQREGVTLKYLIDKKIILLKRQFFATLSNKILLLESIFTYFQ